MHIGEFQIVPILEVFYFYSITFYGNLLKLAVSDSLFRFPVQVLALYLKMYEINIFLKILFKYFSKETKRFYEILSEKKNIYKFVIYV